MLSDYVHSGDDDNDRASDSSYNLVPLHRQSNEDKEERLDKRGLGGMIRW